METHDTRQTMIHDRNPKTHFIFPLVFSSAGLHRSDRILAPAHGGHSVRAGLLCDSVSEALLPWHSPVRDQGDDSENQTAPNGNGRGDPQWGRTGTGPTGKKSPERVVIFL